MTAYDLPSAIVQGHHRDASPIRAPGDPRRETHNDLPDKPPEGSGHVQPLEEETLPPQRTYSQHATESFATIAMQAVIWDSSPKL
jgi:hypothetical protein